MRKKNGKHMANKKTRINVLMPHKKDNTRKLSQTSYLNKMPTL